MLKYRIITAIILIPLVLAALFYLPPIPFGLLTALITVGAAWEWTNLMGLTTIKWRIVYLVFVAMMLLDALFLSIQLLLTIAFIWWLCATILVVFYPRLSAWWGNGKLLRAIMGILVLVPCWRAVNYIRNQDDGVYALLLLFILIWGADSVAYFVGRKWGTTKLAPLVSPGKSVQGLIGALISSIVIALIALWLSSTPSFIWPFGILLSLITVIFSVIGDLFESMLKRQVGVKDSGKLLPGHGGLLDRIDSLTAAAPIYAFGALLLGMWFQ